MSGKAKTILRPKVRFSQFSENERYQEAIEYCKDKAVLRAHGPKIKNIVSLKKPVKIVDSKKLSNANDINVLSENRTGILVCCDNIVCENDQNISVSENAVSKAQISEILCNTSDIQNIKENYKTPQLDNNICKQNDIFKYKNSQKMGKENKDIKAIKKIVFNENTKDRTGDFRYVRSTAHGKIKIPTNSINKQKSNTMCLKNSKMTKPLSVPSVTQKNINQSTKAEVSNAKSTVPNVMSCYKYTNTVMKNKVSSVKKKTVLYNTGPKIKTYIESGISYKQQLESKASNASKECIIASDVTANLAQPKCNSITCTMSKLKELKQQKVVTEINHLPLAQKNLITVKMSTALDFQLDEAIFKDLVELDIDNKQLPYTIMRSKDPEPREKDIMPKLSEFFMPQHMKEICTVVCVKPHIQKIDENWNIYKISDKILDWKYNLNNIQ